MSASQIVITLADPNLGTRHYVFRKPEVCIVGREHDCDIQVPSDDKHLNISRHHCLLLINPPKVRVRDLGSTNGTFVNGVPIGQRQVTSSQAGLTDDTKVELGAATKLRAGDEVRLAKSALCLKVNIVNEPQAARFA
jgi:pSer/pThr/pTyr-binding forkhead associated (FHA) protein